MCLETSREVLGPRRAADKRPHLKGHGTENAQLDADVADALARAREFRNDNLPLDAQRQQEMTQAQQHSRRATVANPVQEQEDWKEHFRKLQEGREIAQETVWQNVAQGGEVAR